MIKEIEIAMDLKRREEIATVGTKTTPSQLPQHIIHKRINVYTIRASRNDIGLVPNAKTKTTKEQLKQHKPSKKLFKR